MQKNKGKGGETDKQSTGLPLLCCAVTCSAQHDGFIRLATAQKIDLLFFLNPYFAA